MKKVLIVLISIFVLTGCFKRDNMEDISIITTVYPIEYVANRIYGDYSEIKSIYPKSSNIDEYEITDKQIKDYSEKDLFIYDGNGDEKDLVISMLNKNKSLKIINATYGIDSLISKSESWLNPSNILMVAQNIKNEFEEYITNPYLINEINDKYNDFKLDIAALETEYKKAADNSVIPKIITTNEALLFLEKYGFTVINLTENGVVKENNLLLAEELLRSKKLSYIFKDEFETDSDVVKELVQNYGATTVLFRIVTTITEEAYSNGEDYLSIMYDNIDKLKEETYK